MKNSIFILHIAIALILLTHAITGMFDGGIHSFGQDYLNQIGFAPVGIPLAWAIKLSHIGCAILLLANKWVKPAALFTIFIFLMGIVLVHFQEGWFVVGGGRNGIEYNFLLICVLVVILLNSNANPKPIRSWL